MHYSFRQSLLAGASALVLTMGVSAAQAGVAIPEPEGPGAWALVNPDLENGPEATTVAGNSSIDNGDVRTNTVSSSHIGGSGIVHEQQNNGNNNAIQAATAVTAALAGSPPPNITSNATVNSNTFRNSTVHNRGRRSNAIQNSYNGFAGQATVQQNNGDHNEIGAATAVYGAAATLGNVDQDSTANSNTEFQSGAGFVGPIVDNGSSRDNLINPSFNNSSGVATVQQNNGNGNAMSAATSVVAGALGAGDVDQDADANADSDFNNVNDFSILRRNRILNSFTNAAGIVTVQQNNGDANAMSAATSVAGFDGDVDDIDQDVDADFNSITNIRTFDGSRTRQNQISGSFNGATGTVTVQQNNGSANQMSAATGVVGVRGNVTDNDLDQRVDADGNDVASFGSISTFDNGNPRTNQIQNSFRGAAGAVTVQQNNGDANTMNAATAVAGVTGDVDDDVDQDVDARSNDVENGGRVTTDDAGSTRTNTINPSFNGASGVITVQQNNGDANTMNAATAVVQVGGDIGGDLEQDVEAEDNTVSFPSTADGGSTRTNNITSSFNSASGIITVQQNNGDANSMNAATAFTNVDGDVNGSDGVEQEDPDIDVEDNEVDVNTTTPSSATRRNNITGSFNGVSGVVTVQQNNGNANSMNVGNAVARVGGDVADDVEQELEVQRNDLDDGAHSDFGSTRSNALTNSFNRASGVTTVQQNNGNGNSMNVGNAIAQVDGDVDEDVQQPDSGDHDIDSNDVDDLSIGTFGGATRSNTISNSFNGASGIHTVQQNNGDGNTMNAATAVTIVDGLVGEDVDQDDTDMDDNDVRRIETRDLRGESRRSNSISGSFNNASGIITVQQNNGGANSMNAATVVAIVGDTVEDIDQDVDVDATVDDIDNQVVAQGQATGGNRSNTINPSFTNADGIITVQQNNGDANSMNAGTLVVIADGAESDDGDIEQDVEVSGTVEDLTQFEDDNGNPRSNTILNSFNRSNGTVTVQQNNGDANVMNAATAHVLFRTGDTGASADETDQNVDATGTVRRNTNTDDDSRGLRTNNITSSFNNGGGVMTVQQNNGTGNVMAAATGVVVDRSRNVNNPGSENVDAQDVDTTGTVDRATSDVDSLAGVRDRQNAITGAFGAHRGIATVQQNNGDNNTVLAATAVRAHDGAGDDIDAVTGATAETTGTVTASGYNNVNNPADDGDSSNNITRSFNGSAGVLTVQQNNGNNNVMGSATGVVANFGATERGGTDAVASSAIGSGTVIGNTAKQNRNAVSTNAITSSFNRSSLVGTVQQNNGHNNVMGAATQVSADQGSFGPAASVAILSATVTGNSIINPTTGPIVPDSFSNSISGSFNGTSGVVTVQQNNGSNNVIGSAISTVVNF